MGPMLEIWGILFLTIVTPLWIIFHYATKARDRRALTAEDEKLLGELWESTRAMEDRITTLERILDDRAPGWRGHRS